MKRVFPDTDGVYIIQCVINNRMYIGSTFSIKMRVKQHFYLLENNKSYSALMQKDYNKYGKKSFLISYKKTDDLDDARGIESDLILKLKPSYNTTFPINKQRKTRVHFMLERICRGRVRYIKNTTGFSATQIYSALNGSVGTEKVFQSIYTLFKDKKIRYRQGLVTRTYKLDKLTPCTHEPKE